MIILKLKLREKKKILLIALLILYYINLQPINCMCMVVDAARVDDIRVSLAPCQFGRRFTRLKRGD